MFNQYLNKCIEGFHLSTSEAEIVMNEIMEGNITSSQIASLITILRFRGETVEEMTGFARAMRSHMMKIHYDFDGVIDTCGTGGDCKSTFNISTASSIVASSIGVKIAKHGNRAVSSKSGSADVLEYLGIDIQSNPEEAKDALEEHGMSFLFAPIYHSAMKNVVKPRKEIGFRTVFNILGPLANPARVQNQVIGVYSTQYAEKMAETMKNLGSRHVLFVTGRDGLDECSITTETDVVELKNGEISRYTITPNNYGLKYGSIQDVQVNTISESAALLEHVLLGDANESAVNIVLLNAACAIYVAGKVASISEGIELAKEAISSGLAYKQFKSLQKKVTKRYVN